MADDDKQKGCEGNHLKKVSGKVLIDGLALFKT